MAPRKSPKHSELFFTTFAGEYVRVMTTLIVTETMSNEDSMTSNQTPLTVEGFLLDFDDSFIYMGTGPDNVTHAISKASISLVEVSNETVHRTVYDDILDSMTPPEREEDIN